MNATITALACLALLLFSACGEPEDGRGSAPVETPSGETDPEEASVRKPTSGGRASVEARTLLPDHAPTPYSADEIRAGCPAGRLVTWRVTKDGADPFIHSFRFLEGTPENTRFVVGMEGGADPAQTSPPIERPWKSVQQHASFPLDQTVISDVVLDTEAGRHDCWFYTVTVPGEAEGSEEVRQYWFGKDRPGPPLQMIFVRDGAETYRQMLVSDEILPLPPEMTSTQGAPAGAPDAPDR